MLWYPSVMANVAGAALRFAVENTLKTPQRFVPQFAPLGGVPATYKLPPSRTAVLAAATGTVEVTTGGVWVISTTAILAAVPPHSGPQFSTYAIDPSELKTAPTGLSKVPDTGARGLPLVSRAGVSTVTLFAVSETTRMLLPVVSGTT